MTRAARKLALILGGALLLVSGLVVAADIPGDKAEISIDLIEGKKSATPFPHAKHATEFKKKGGAKIECKDCHHTLASDREKPKACSECHVKVGEAEKEIGGKKAPALAKEKSPGKIDQKSVIFHINCKDGCHKEMKAEGKKITSCTVCHPK
jgi:hypothetical protein